MTLDTKNAKRTLKLEVAIRLKRVDGDGFDYVTHREDSGRYAIEPLELLTLETAKTQVQSYFKKYEPAIVTRETLTFIGEWEEITTTELHELADLLHKKQCHSYHVAECDFDYDNPQAATKKYLEKAKAILEKTSFEAAKELLEIL